MLDFHGVPVELAYPAFPGDPLRKLLTRFPPSSARMPGVRVELSTDAAPRAPFGSEWTPTFCHGLAQGYTRGDEHRLTDGASELEIAPGARRLRGRVCMPVTELTSGMLHVAFCLLLREHGMFDAHAAVACTDDRALLVLGDAGSGKTTTLLALLRAGATYLGDDRVLLRSGGAGIELLGYPRDFHLTRETLRGHPALDDERAPATIDGKLRLDPHTAFPERFAGAFRGRLTLLAPSIADRRATQLTPLGAADAFGQLLSASAGVALEVLLHREAQLELLTQLANSASAFSLELGRDLLSEPEAAGARLIELVAGKE